MRCSKEETIPPNTSFVKDSTLQTVAPEYARIGDTIEITGKYLDRINFQFNDYIVTSPLYKDSDNASIIVPAPIYNENVTIYAMYGPWPGLAIDSLPFHLVGFFSLKDPLPYGEITHINAIDEKVFLASIGSSLYKTTNGGYQWTIIKNFGASICSFFFLDALHGWICLSEDSGYNLYCTEDGGQSFRYLMTTGENWQGKSITEMHFLSLNEGYILSAKGEIYYTMDNTHFNLVYDFPQSNEQSGYTEFLHLTVYNHTVMATGMSGPDGITPVLISGKNNSFKYVTLSLSPGNIQLIGENEAFLTMDGLLYHTADGGTHWEKVCDTVLYKFYFRDENIGFAISMDNFVTSHHHFLYTVNGGKEWQLGFDTLNEFATNMAFNGKAGLFSGFRGLVWKYVER